MTRIWQDAADAALNAVVGDHLDRQHRSLSIEMGLYDRGVGVQAPTRGATRLCVLVHGMGCTERFWSFPDAPELDYGRLLARDRGYAPVYVRYNTGLPIFENGQKLADLLDSIVDHSPVPIEEVMLIGHSLGGLVIRSACHAGADRPWLRLVRRAFYIGTPHLGSPVAKAGHLLAEVLHQIPDPVVQALAALAEIRSTAIRELRLGDIVQGGGAVPLDPRIEHFAIGGTMPGALAALALGDGLVRPKSATAAIAPDHIGVFEGLHHMALVHHPDVYQWIAARAGESAAASPAPASTPETTAQREAHRAPASAYVALAAEAVGRGAATVQTAHEAIAARTYRILEAIEPIAEASRAVRSVHFGILRATYAGLQVTTELIRTTAQSAAPTRAATDPAPATSPATEAPSIS